MSSYVYPTIAGLTFPIGRTPIFKTNRPQALSGKRSALAYRQYPLIHFELTYSILRDDETPSDIKALVGLYEAMMGGFDTFLFQDPDFNTFPVSNPQLFGIGDNQTTAFQLVAYYQNTGGPGYGQIIQNLTSVPVIYSNGGTVSSANYTLGPSGIITFNSAPAAGALLTWSGAFMYRCEFDEDELKGLAKFMNQWWGMKKVAFTSVKL
jgi:uncharacterized protein (TIGR02217 family)